MIPFTKNESKALIIIFSVLFVIVSFNMSISLRRGRDSIRKNDISAIQNVLDTYFQKYKVYPESTDDGEIIGCFADVVHRDALTGYPNNTIVCNWGKSYFESENLLPRDPKYKNGTSYLYISSGQSYEFYIALEGKDEAEYNKAIVLKNLQCGTKICNYGRSN